MIDPQDELEKAVREAFHGAHIVGCCCTEYLAEPCATHRANVDRAVRIARLVGRLDGHAEASQVCVLNCGCHERLLRAIEKESKP